MVIFVQVVFFQRLYNQDQGKAIMASRPSCSDRSRPKNPAPPNDGWNPVNNGINHLSILINWCNIFWNHPQYVGSQENMCQRLMLLVSTGKSC